MEDFYITLEGYEIVLGMYKVKANTLEEAKEKAIKDYCSDIAIKNYSREEFKEVAKKNRWEDEDIDVLD